MDIAIEDWGNGIPIRHAIEKQDNYWAEKVFKKDTPDKLIFVEHEPVYTAGASCALNSDLIKQCLKKEIWELPAPIEITRRGGLVTYQGPGILSVYFIFSLKNLSPHSFNQFLLNSAEAFLNTYGISTQRHPKNLGLYIGGHKKIVSVGTQISQGVSRYGFAVSLNPDAKYLEPLMPCGLENMRMTSLAEELNVKNFSESEKSEIKIELANEIISRK